MKQNKVKRAITLEYKVNEELNKFIDERKVSAFINSLLEKELRKKATEEFNNIIDAIKPIKANKSSVDTVRELRNERLNKVAGGKND